ncbi:SDR family oxidoreductase [Iodobacter sp. LRB]|uniref:SDR family oxidoreductase n=1 Tax=unclassified Iodobacter TaxID=235634 RepID=UPI000C1078EE|nr:SDR family oxidoreductase [Iodobacter sp. BJB302]PHU99874.1 short-chain dehydrogenase/reductase [Iodobacter sp. BJB302]
MNNSTQFKNIIITGTSGGFGLITAKALASKGHHVFASMRDITGRNAASKNELENFAKQHNYKIDVIELDVTDDASVTSAVDSIVQLHGRIDVLINNAGVMNIGVTEAFSIAEMKAQFEVNTFGPARAIRAVLPTMRAQGDGLIISVSSLAGRVVFPFFGMYNASKYALEALAEAYHYELSGLGIESIVVEPGPFGTGLLGASPAPKDEMITQAYGEIGQIPTAMKTNFQQMYDSANAPRIEDVPDAIVRLVEQTSKRPLRTVVMPAGMDFGVDRLNESAGAIQNDLLKILQLDSMI